jgi:V/A-type H+-transporting ATPase subunit D
VACRAQIGLAAQGCQLLEDKRHELMKELRRTAEAVLEEADALERAAASAREALSVAEALDGPEALRSAALVAEGDASLAVTTVSIMGIPVPEIEHRPWVRPRVRRGYALSATSPRIDAVAEGFEHELDLVVQVAAGEVRLSRLAAEIRATTRRVNALEQLVIPGLERERDAIRMALDEREREDQFRLRRLRRRRSGKEPG